MKFSRHHNILDYTLHFYKSVNQIFEFAKYLFIQLSNYKTYSYSYCDQDVRLYLSNRIKNQARREAHLLTRAPGCPH